MSANSRQIKRACRSRRSARSISAAVVAFESVESRTLFAGGLGPTLSTTPTPTSLTLSNTTPEILTDTALLQGGNGPTGTITFSLYYNNGSTPVDTEVVTIPGDGSYTTPAGYTLPTASPVTGTYQWDATYSGNNGTVNDIGNTNEQVTVSPAGPAITTTPNPSNVTLGTISQTLKDSATLSGGYAPTGTITFTLYYNGGATPIDSETVAVNGDNTYSTPTGYPLPTTDTVTGSYQWDASYSGDGNNTSASDNNNSTEKVTVSPASPAITTTPSPSAVTLGAIPQILNDSATLSGGYFPTGTITFTLYYNGGATPIDSETVAVNGDNTYSTPTGYTLPTASTVTGIYQWDASYSGDTNNSSVSDNGNSSEQVTVTPATPTIVTSQLPTSATVGSSIKDQAAVSGGYNPTGTVTFNLYSNSAATGAPLFTDTETLSGGIATSALYTPTATGTDYWVDTYNGDGNNSSISSGVAAEPVTITPASPAIVTTPNPTGLTLGTTSPTLQDTATLSGGYSPTGTITFTLYQGATLVDTETAAVTGDGAYSTPFGYTLPTSGTVTGSYQWDASYSGDGNNSAATDNNNSSETVTVSPASPAITTSPGGTVVLGSGAALTDTAVLSGGYSPTGTITFTLYAPDDTTVVDTEAVTVSGDGSYSTPHGYVPSGSGTLTGTYEWAAAYSGDTNNNAVSSPPTAETVTVSPAGPSITTTPNLTTPTLGVASQTLKDSANLSGGYLPTGTITFTLYQGITLVDTETATVTGDGIYSTPTGYSLPTTGVVTGAYQWDASYSGDGNNTAVSDNNDSSEKVTVSPAGPTIITTPSAASVTLGTVSPTLKDTAALSGGYYPTGTITFTLYQGITLVDTETATVSGDGTYTTPSGYTLPVSGTVTGTYQWDASYSGDGNNTTASDSNDSAETVTVSPANPTITTTQSPTSGTVGSSLMSDQATLSGGYNPTGTIDFKLTAPGGGVTDEGSVTVTGDGTYTAPDTVLATATGTYYWVATYSGDSNNNGVASGATAEPVTATSATPTIVTAQQPAIAIVGTSIADKATVSGGYNPSGTVTFNLYNNSTASGTPLFTDTETLSGGIATSAGYTATVTNTDYWVATYNGDSNNSSVSSGTALEPVIITPATPTIVTTQQPASATVGTSIADKATVSGGYNPSGTVTFNLYSNSTASGTPLFTDTETLVSGIATSAGYTATATNTDYWVATYNGDSNNTSVTSGTALEPVTITSASPTINTAQQPASATVGTSIADKATVSGGYNPSGTVTFNLYNNSTASGTPLFTDTETLSGGIATSAGYTAIATNTDYWVATYNGDSNNSKVSSGTALEPVTITPASPAINTSQQPASATVGTSIADKATVSGGYNPSGTVTFNLYSNSTASGTPLFTDTETLVSGIANSAGYTATATNTDYWVATYNGDSNNSSVSSGTALEPVTITPASPAINTSQQPASAIVGTSIADKATVTGGYNPSGTVTFDLYSNATGSGTPLFIDTETLSGGTATSKGYTAAATGTDYWVATYNGDSNNSKVSSGTALEPVTINKATPVLTTTASKSGNGMCGSTTITDVGILASGYNPTGTITFTLVDPTGATISTQTVTIGGDGNYSPTAVSATKVGTYTWHATYNGDGNNISVNDQGGTVEQITIGKNSATVTTTASTKSGSGNVVGTAVPEDSAVISGGFNPTGSVTFTLKNPSGSVIDTQAITVTGDGTYSTTNTVIATAVGTYTWTANYSGDANNNSANDQGGTAEQISVVKATPVLTTTASESGNGMCGSTTITDVGVLASGYNPTGTITFTLVDPTGATISTQTITIGGDGNYSPTAVSATKVGTYTWHATYNGDGNNILVNDQGGTAEQITIGGATISGTKFLDIAGNGFSSDDTPQPGIVIDLYQESNSTSGLQTGSGGDKLVATATTASSGMYSFTGLAAGTYYVLEVVPSGYVQTGGGPNGAAGSTYYTVTVNSATTYGGNNFDDYQIPTCNPTCVSFVVNNNNCLTTVGDLRGNTQQGDSVTVTFTVTAGMSDQLSLASYIAPTSTFNSSNAYEQVIFDEASGIFTPGTHTLTVLIPNCYYQIDFFCGPPINELGPPNYGPDSSNIFYSAEDRLISADNSGTQAYATKAVTSGNFATAGYWSTTTGQNVLKSLNGSSSATNLAQWLATTFPNLYGSGAGSHSLVNSNGTYFTNSQLISAYSKFTGGDQQVLSAALSVYATSINLAGTNIQHTDSHFTTSLAGSGMDTYNIGSNGATFGVSNSTVLTVMQLLVDLNASTSAGAAVASGANTVFSAINTTGNVTNADLSDVGLAYTPAEIRAAYGFNSLSLDGTGQTIAIVDAYDDPDIFQALDSFDTQFGETNSGPSLYQQYGAASSFLTVLGQSGQSDALPDPDPTGGWEVEEELDVEWAHAMAPGAQIIVVEADSDSLLNLMSSVATAAAQPNVSVVSMSWGFPEGQVISADDEAYFDQYLTTPAGHQGVSFVASTGDWGSADPEYPAFSPNVVAVGGTSLYLNPDSSYNSETGWGYYSSDVGEFIGSGGGNSMFEPEPAYQTGVQSTGNRSTPDVSLVADPATGVWIADPYNLPSNSPWEVVGGTSLSAPLWGGLLALVNQGRTAAGQPTLNSTNPTDVQQALYSVSSNDYNQINGGYNTVTGLGSPIVGLLVPDLIAHQSSTDLPAASISWTGQAPTDLGADAASANAMTFPVSDALVVSEYFGKRTLDLGSGFGSHSFIGATGRPMSGSASLDSVLATDAQGAAGTTEDNGALTFSTSKLSAWNGTSDATLRESTLSSPDFDSNFQTSSQGLEAAAGTLSDATPVESPGFSDAPIFAFGDMGTGSGYTAMTGDQSRGQTPLWNAVDAWAVFSAEDGELSSAELKRRLISKLSPVDATIVTADRSSVSHANAGNFHGGNGLIIPIFAIGIADLVDNVVGGQPAKSADRRRAERRREI